MKSLSVLAFLATLASAQNAVIRAPLPTSTFAPGERFVVQLERPNSLTNSREVSMAVGLLSCVGQAPPGTCDGIDPEEQMGTILLAGPYKPVFEPGTGALSQNFTVAIPNGFQTGPAVLSVAHFALVGARVFPLLEVPYETVFIH